MADIFGLTSENLTHLGGPMGTEYTYDNWTKFYPSLQAAMTAAEKDYEQGGRLRGSVVWTIKDDGAISQDLGYVMYRIKKVKVEGDEACTSTT